MASINELQGGELNCGGLDAAEDAKEYWSCVSSLQWLA